MIVVLAGCSTIPIQELQGLHDGFFEAQKAGDLLYDEISIIINSTGGDSNSCAPNSRGAPRCFDPSQVSSGTRVQEHASVRARRMALELITQYTLALVEVAEGKSADDIKSNVGQITELATGLLGLVGVPVPGILGSLTGGPGGAALNGLLGQLSTIQANAKIRQSLIAERQTVAELVNVLIEDTSVMYQVYFNHRKLRVLKGLGSEQDEMTTAANYHKSLTAYVLILKQAKRAHERLVEATRRPLTSIGDLRVVMEQAINLKRSAQEFWTVIREVRR